MVRRRNSPSSLAEAFGELRADYSAAKASRFRRRRTGVSAIGSGADYHYRSEADYLRILEQARDMDRNDCVVGQTVDRAVGNTLQNGFTLDTQTGDEALDLDLWQRWDDWATDADQCSVDGELTFPDLEWLAYRQTIVDGDTVVLPILDDGTLQLVEGHRLRTPKNTSKKVVHGIMLDSHRKRLEYWLTKDDIDPSKSISRVGEMEVYHARDAFGQKQVFHVFDPKRVTQTRGVSAFAPIFDCLGMFEDINFAKLVQQQVVSCFAIFRELALDADTGTGTNPQRGTLTTETLADGTTRRVEGISPGMEVTGRPGEKLQGFSPNVPNAEFFQHVRLILTLVGINLGMPLVMVLMDAEATNFSGFRGAVDQARLQFRRNQQWFMRRFHCPIYKWKVRQWMATDSALRNAAKKSTIKIFGHKWCPPKWPYIEPLKDASADLLRLRNGLTSPRRLHAERGDDDDEIVSETVADNAKRIRTAKTEAMKINSEFDDGTPVHWRELLSLPTPDGVTAHIGEVGKEDDESGSKSGKQPAGAAA